MLYKDLLANVVSNDTFYFSRCMNSVLSAVYKLSHVPELKNKFRNDAQAYV